MRVPYKRLNKPDSYHHSHSAQGCEVPAPCSLWIHSSMCSLLSGCCGRHDFHFSSTACFHHACKARACTADRKGNWEAGHHPRIPLYEDSWEPCRCYSHPGPCQRELSLIPPPLLPFIPAAVFSPSDTQKVLSGSTKGRRPMSL